MHGAWPGYSSQAGDAGAGSIFCFPLQVGAVRFGVLSVVAKTPTLLGRRGMGSCLTMAELATESLLDGFDEDPDDGTEPDLGTALGAHSEIYQAQGMVAVALGIPLAQALARMRGHSFQSDRALLEVAIDIIEGRLSLPDDSTAP
ncbi:hypothetical protein BH11ACT8_BH11ACT8_30200 [soil metagenome]